MYDNGGQAPPPFGPSSSPNAPPFDSNSGQAAPPFAPSSTAPFATAPSGYGPTSGQAAPPFAPSSAPPFATAPTQAPFAYGPTSGQAPPPFGPSSGASYTSHTVIHPTGQHVHIQAETSYNPSATNGGRVHYVPQYHNGNSDSAVGAIVCTAVCGLIIVAVIVVGVIAAGSSGGGGGYSGGGSSFAACGDCPSKKACKVACEQRYGQSMHAKCDKGLGCVCDMWDNTISVCPAFTLEGNNCGQCGGIANCKAACKRKGGMFGTDMHAKCDSGFCTCDVFGVETVTCSAF